MTVYNLLGAMAAILRPLQEGTTCSDRWQVEIDFSNKAPHEILRTDSRVSEDVDSKNGLISFLKFGPPLEASLQVQDP